MVKRLLVGVSGASGAVYGVRLLETLRELEVESHLILSKAATLTIGHEMDLTVKQVRALVHKTYPVEDVGAACASGSFPMAGMIITPCSMRTLAEIATGATSSLLTRAADVTLKERRRLVLMVRETPLNASHLKNMLAVTEMGGIIAPPVPAFYTRPASIEEMVDQSLGRVLDLFGLDTGRVKRWRYSPDGNARS